MTVDDHARCTNVSRKGHRCRCKRTEWGSAEHGWPQPDPARCGFHLTDEEKAAREYGRFLDYARMFPGAILPPDPACWSWPVPPDTTAKLQKWREATPAEIGRIAHGALFHDALDAYDQGRCAICGRPGNPVEDHDHETGLVRGWLCRSCNTREGMNGGTDNIFGRYRARHPYSILGIREPYSGFGWEDGRPIGYGPGEWPRPTPDRWRDNAMRDAL